MKKNLVKYVEENGSQPGDFFVWDHLSCGVPTPESSREVITIPVNRPRNGKARLTKGCGICWRLEFMEGDQKISVAYVRKGVNLGEPSSNIRSIKGLLRIIRRYLGSGQLPAFTAKKAAPA